MLKRNKNTYYYMDDELEKLKKEKEVLLTKVCKELIKLEPKMEQKNE